MSGHVQIGIDNCKKVAYSKHMTRTYMIHAGLTFLGYEYGESKDEVLFRTRSKFGDPNNWNVTEYTANIVRWREELECTNA
jgi:hypothetical protein